MHGTALSTCHYGAGVVQAVALTQQRHVVGEHAADVRPCALRVRRPPARRPVSKRLGGSAPICQHHVAIALTAVTCMSIRKAYNYADKAGSVSP